MSLGAACIFLRGGKNIVSTAVKTFLYFFGRFELMFANCYKALIGLKQKRHQEMYREGICAFTTAGHWKMLQCNNFMYL